LIINDNDINNSKKEKNKEQKNIIIIDNKDYNNNNLDYDYYFDEQFKIYYKISIILELSSELFNENINKCK